MTLSSTRETAQHLFNSGRYTEALPLLKAATEELPNEENWQYLVLAASRIDQHEEAAALAQTALSQHPKSDWLWRHLGYECTVLDRLPEAATSLQNAERLNPNAPFLWRYKASLSRKQKDAESEIEALETLMEMGEADSYDLNLLGIAHHNQRDLARALRSYRLAAAADVNPSALFNMGLIFCDPELSQDADAADAFRRVLIIDPSHERAQEGLAAAKSKLIPLAASVGQLASELVDGDNQFSFYINPFELLQFDCASPVAEIDTKVLQRAKTRLLQEIELNDGIVSWMDDCQIDKSRALAAEHELHDLNRRHYHWVVFKNTSLLRFLTRGDVGQFLYSEEYFPHDTLSLLESDSEFRGFLTKPFASQYNVLLTHAIDRKLLPVVEALLDGRRWVSPEDEDLCFEGASKRIDSLIELMHDKVTEGDRRKLNIDELEDFLRQHEYRGLFNLLPTAFASAQYRLVSELRSLAISTYNKHQDAVLSKGILALCKQFVFRSVELNSRLQEDFKTIERLISEENEQIAEAQQHSFSATVYERSTVQVTRDGIAYGGTQIPPGDIEAIRWGIVSRTVNGVETEHTCALTVRSDHATVSVVWQKRGMIAAAKSLFRKPGQSIPIADMSSEAQDQYFYQMIDSVIYHLLPSFVSKVLQRIRDGKSLVVGPCTLSREGIHFKTGLLFRKNHFLPWKDADTTLQGGQVLITSRTNRVAKTSMPAKHTENAVILPIVVAAMRDSSN